jgi:YidC/Oxa1 family membrane protein insertase
MLFDWSSFWTSIGWSSFNTGTGSSFLAMFALGPYFNLLPLLTITLFLIQQAVMMPPPTDDQSRMQRKMMQYMMIVMGFFFFKIPSGLCIYFIVSTTWGLLERRFIPKKPVENTSKESNTPKETNPTSTTNTKNRKRTTRHNEEQNTKKEGFFAKLIREVTEKAAEQRKLGQVTKKNKKKK